MQLSTDGERWRVEARQDAETDWWHRDYVDEASARRLVGEMLERGAQAGEWHDITTLLTMGPVNPNRRPRD